VHHVIRPFAGQLGWPGANASLVIGLGRGHVNVALTNRRVTIESVNGRSAVRSPERIDPLRRAAAGRPAAR
jgi:hypothetical protein